MLPETLYKIINNDPELTSLNLDNSSLDFSKRLVLTDIDIKNLAEALANNTHLKSLSLRNINISTVGLSYLCTALKSNKTLQVLNLSYNPIKKEGLVSLFEALKENQSLQKLSLRGVSIFPAELASLETFLIDNFSIRELEVDPQFKYTIKKFIEKLKMGFKYNIYVIFWNTDLDP